VYLVSLPRLRIAEHIKVKWRFAFIGFCFSVENALLMHRF
jgi:hypothetical protein